VTTAASQPAPIDANAVVEQMVKSMMLRTAQSGSSEIRLRLVPDSLGEVTMKITVQGSQINANVVAQNADVRNALLTNQQQLARSLADAGLTLSGFSVDVSGGDAGKDNNRDRTGGFGRRYAVHELAAKDGESETESVSSSEPQLVSRSTLELLNYLA
jgi:flagellar hook-length control protein FliK